ncbi:MAG TPA: metallophosphatase domain-containing protein [Pyrinomonadaceae bacterium]|nr:metallophosphatase domain-containing protein [Pyrinomonadaceae bacterium]
MKIVCISDTHTFHNEIVIPDGDILIHAGDFTIAGEIWEIAAFNEWLGTLPHKHKIVIAGNHDWLFQKNPTLARSLITNAIYLEDSMTEIEGLKIYGSPWQPWFMDWAFNLPRGHALAEKWALIPEGIDILVTHSPPMGVLDKTRASDRAGCSELTGAVLKIKPRLHIFGHIHEGYGKVEIDYTRFINASTCDAAYRAINKPLVVELEPEASALSGDSEVEPASVVST